MSGRQVTVFVAGSWGTALAAVLAHRGNDVTLWTRSREHAAQINEQRRNSRFLGDIVLPDGIRAVTDIAEAAAGKDALLFVAPSSAMREVARAAYAGIRNRPLIMHATKGFETGSLKRMTDVLAEEMPSLDASRFVVLSGPSHAEEVIRKCPTTVVVASQSLSAASEAQDLLINPYFRVYTNPDVTGVEVSGALKNIIAIGAGLTDGLNFGDNARAALLTRGLAEISRLGTAMGANPLTFSGLAGIGDLVVTATSRHSRNWRAGYALAQGRSVEDTLREMGMVVEGIRTTQSARTLASQYDVQMPITEELYRVLFEGKQPMDAVRDLMDRGRRHEVEEAAETLEYKWLP